MHSKLLSAAVHHTLPVLMGYLSIGLVFGWMMSAAGFIPLWSVAMSMVVYAGSGQYLGVDLLSNASPLADVAFFTFIINFRHLVYGLSMLSKFHYITGWRKLYMIFALTDETYALLAGAHPPKEVKEQDFYFVISLLDQLYWIAGTLIGAVAGAIITINTEGIDFAMTALFLVIAVEQWLSGKQHLPALLGIIGPLACLFTWGPEGGRFLIPALVILVTSLLLLRPVLDKAEEPNSAQKGENLL